MVTQSVYFRNSCIALACSVFVLIACVIMYLTDVKLPRNCYIPLLIFSSAIAFGSCVSVLMICTYDVPIVDLNDTRVHPHQLSAPKLFEVQIHDNQTISIANNNGEHVVVIINP